jgi:hypothetical protein
MVDGDGCESCGGSQRARVRQRLAWAFSRARRATASWYFFPG